jgi:hypothetical protein
MTAAIPDGFTTGGTNTSPDTQACDRAAVDQRFAKPSPHTRQPGTKLR